MLAPSFLSKKHDLQAHISHNVRIIVGDCVTYDSNINYSGIITLKTIVFMFIAGVTFANDE